MSYLKKLLGQEERVLFITHKHWLFFVRDNLGTVLAALVIVVVGALALTVFGWGEAMILGWKGNIVIPMVTVVALAVPVSILTFKYVEWRVAQYVVTSLRVIHLHGILSKSVLDSSLEKVNDVLLRQSVFGRLFNYGDIEILTASEAAINKLSQVAEPLTFKSTMLNAKRALETEISSDEQARSVPEVIAELASLRDRGLLTDEEFEAKKRDLLERM